MKLGWSARQGDARPLTVSDRQAIADLLRRALDAGRLDPAGFEQRAAATRAAATTAEAAPLVADLTDPPAAARRGWTDELFDLVVVNSALVTAPRHRILKAAWKAVTATILVIYGCLLVWQPRWAVTVLWMPTVLLMWAATTVTRALAGPTCARQLAVLARLGTALDLLRAAQPAINEFTVEHAGRVVLVHVEFDESKPDRDLVPSVRDEVVRLCWLSRLFPMTEIRLTGVRPAEVGSAEPGSAEVGSAEPGSAEVGSAEVGSPEQPSGAVRSGETGSLGVVRPTGEEAARLRQRHGPRPYGPYPRDARR